MQLQWRFHKLDPGLLFLLSLLSLLSFFQFALFLSFMQSSSRFARRTGFLVPEPRTCAFLSHRCLCCLIPTAYTVSCRSLPLEATLRLLTGCSFARQSLNRCMACYGGVGRRVRRRRLDPFLGTCLTNYWSM